NDRKIANDMDAVIERRRVRRILRVDKETSCSFVRGEQKIAVRWFVIKNTHNFAHATKRGCDQGFVFCIGHFESGFGHKLRSNDTHRETEIAQTGKRAERHVWQIASGQIDQRRARMITSPRKIFRACNRNVVSNVWIGKESRFPKIEAFSMPLG